MGRSLGTGVAIYVAQNKPVKSVVLVSPYDSIENMARDQYPIFPINMLLKNKFNSISRVSSIKCLMLTIIGDKDITVPNWRSQKIVDSWGGQSRLEVIKNEDHNSLSENKEYWKDINYFLIKNK